MACGCGRTTAWMTRQHLTLSAFRTFPRCQAESLHGRFTAEVAWLVASHEAGATIASACSSALLLAEAGLLAGCDATTHWAFAADLARYPNVKVRTNQSLVVTGVGERIVMAGGGTSWLDMALYLIARYIGLKEARQVARIHMLDWHDGGQLPYASLLVTKQIDDAVILRCQEWVALNYATAAPVAAMMRIVGLPERSFMRRFYCGHRDVTARVCASSANRGSQTDAGNRRRTDRGGGCRGRLPGRELLQSAVPPARRDDPGTLPAPFRLAPSRAGEMIGQIAVVVVWTSQVEGMDERGARIR